MLDKGASMTDVQDQYFSDWCRYQRSLHRYADDVFLRTHSERQNPRILILWSAESGTGKTYYARKTFPTAYWHRVATFGSQWWDGYQGQDTVVFDEFDSAFIPYRDLLGILDRSSLRVPVKGDHKWAACHKFVFTTNLEPAQWYPHQPLPRS